MCAEEGDDDDDFFHENPTSKSESLLDFEVHRN